MGPAADPAIKALLKLKRDPSGRVREAVTDALYGIETQNRDFATAFEASQKLAIQRFIVIQDLEQPGPDAMKKQMREIVKLLRNDDWFVKFCAASSLGRMGSDAKSAINALEELLGSDDSEVHCAAIEALGAIGPNSKSAVAAIAQSLRSKDGQVRAAAAKSLGDIGPGSKAAILDLDGLLNDKDGDVRRAAAEALKKIEPSGQSAKF